MKNGQFNVCKKYYSYKNNNLYRSALWKLGAKRIIYASVAITAKAVDSKLLKTKYC